MKKIFKLFLRSLLVLFILLNIVVIFQAYKFTHYYERNEVLIKKQENKTGWDISKEIMFGANYVKQENTAPDTVVQTVQLVTANNLSLEAWYIPVANAKGSIAMFHGHGGKKSSMLPEAAYFRKMGYNILLVDFRAHGNSQGNTCTIGYKEAEDVKLAYDWLKNKGEQNITLYGISLGAATITKAINDYPIKPSRLILEMPFGTLTNAVEGRVKMMGLPAQPISTLLTFWGGTLHGFWAFNLSPETYAKKITCPVLLQRGTNDPRVTAEETNMIYHHISSPKKLVLYENSGHESLYKKEPQKWEAEVKTFLQ